MCTFSNRQKRSHPQRQATVQVSGLRTPIRLWGVILAQGMKPAAHQLWASLPHLYRQYVVTYTDVWAAYAAVLPSKRHHTVGKETGKASYVERFNNTLRQRVSRLVRKTLSFSKSLENHIGAIWYFIHHYNASFLLSTWTSL